MMKTILLSFCLLLFVAFSVQQDDLISVEGFIKQSQDLQQSNSNFDFSVVKVELYSISGSSYYLKESTQCSKTGYYVLAVYNPGEYELRVVGPEGWTFDPSSKRIQLEFGAEANTYDFTLKGFTVKGKVGGRSAEGEDKVGGPKGVTVNLINSDGEVVGTTVTEANGHYTFKSVLPGKYTVKATHPRWTVKGEASVEVATSSALVPALLQVLGYDITGKVVSNGLPMADVQFSLSPCPPKKTESGSCSIVSDENGKFAFKDVPTGSYTLVPYYKGFTVAPQRIQIEMRHDSIDLTDKVFEIKGFTVRGSLSKAIEGVAIFLNKKQVATTDSTGSFELNEVSTGKYNIDASKEHYVFESLKGVELLPSKPELDKKIELLQVDVCGKVIFSNDSPFSVKGRNVLLLQSGKKIDSTTTDADGSFCLKVAVKDAATYELKADISESERKQGLLLQPSSHTINTSKLTGPILWSEKGGNIQFSQGLLSVAGALKTVAGGSFEVKLEDLRTKNVLSTKTDDNGAFKFTKLMPYNKYRVSVVKNPNQKWCWHQQGQQLVDLQDREITDIELTQEGFSLNIVASHEGIIVKSKEDSKEITLKQGLNTICVPRLDVFEFTARDANNCIQFDKDVYSVDMNQEQQFEVKAVKYLVKGTIVKEKYKQNLDSDEQQATIELYAVGTNKEKVELAETKENSFEYQFYANIDEEVKLTPQSSIYGFKPAFIKVSALTETKISCPKTLETIKALKGIFLKGKVTPAVEGVEITVMKQKTSGEQEEVIKTSTNQAGEYKAGPLYLADSNEEYFVSASKAGYKFTYEDEKKLNLVSILLSQLTVKVQSATDKAPVSGVFISLVSPDAGYRNNSLSNEQGVVVFPDLAPGQYTLKPLLKEYKFEPSGMITIEIKKNEGNRDQIIQAKRVQYSAFGSIKSLNGYPLENAVIEALPVNRQDIPVEETKSDSKGNFRIRGLNPSVKYQVRVKKQKSANVDVEKASPETYTVEQSTVSDYQGLDFLGFSSLAGQYEIITGQVQTNIEVITAKDKNKAVIDVELLSGTDPLSAKIIRSTRLPINRFFQFTVPKAQDAKINYYVRLSTNLDRKEYTYSSPILPVKDLQTGENQHVVLQFYPSQNTADIDSGRQHARSKPQFYLLIALLLAGVAFITKDTWSPLLESFSRAPEVSSRPAPAPRRKDVRYR